MSPIFEGELNKINDAMIHRIDPRLIDPNESTKPLVAGGVEVRYMFYPRSRNLTYVRSGWITWDVRESEEKLVRVIVANDLILDTSVSMEPMKSFSVIDIDFYLGQSIRIELRRKKEGIKIPELIVPDEVYMVGYNKEMPSLGTQEPLSRSNTVAQLPVIQRPMNSVEYSRFMAQRRRKGK